MNKLSLAKSKLALAHPFFGAIALRLDYKRVENLNPPTMAVDGYTIFWHPDFIEELSVEEIQAVIAHEVLHVIMLHTTRIKDRNHMIWSMACDYAINPIVKDSNLKLPEGGLLNSEYSGKPAEEIYNLLLKEAPEEKDFLNFGNILPPPKDQEPTAEQAAKILATIGAIAGKTAGKMPGGIEKLLDDTLKPKVNWKHQLRNLITATVEGDLTWNRPNRRYLEHMYLPYYEEEPQIESITVALDTSGSVSQEELNTYASEIQAIREDANIETINVIYVDTKVQQVQTFKQPEKIKFKAVGGGGTRFEPAFKWQKDQIRKNNNTPSALIYFTDGCASFPTENPEYTTIWCITNNEDCTPPWGHAIHINL